LFELRRLAEERAVPAIVLDDEQADEQARRGIASSSVQP
jgi:hypothetical protein